MVGARGGEVKGILGGFSRANGEIPLGRWPRRAEAGFVFAVLALPDFISL